MASSNIFAHVPVKGDHHHRALSQDDNMLEDDEVFSNPDTAELESSRSDATGATSPTPNSPGPSSPSNRGTSHVAIVTSQHSDPYGTMKQSEYQGGQAKQQGPPQLTLANLPSTNMSQLQYQFEKEANVETPRANAAPITAARPVFGRTMSGSGISTISHQSPLLSSNPTSRVVTPRLGGHGPSHSASHLTYSLAHGQPLPSAHDMPSDPREASTLSKLFAHPPAQSPSEELASFSLGSDGTQHLPRSGTASMLATPSTPLAASSPFSSRLRSRPTTRPSSPERMSSPSRIVSAGLGLGVGSRHQTGQDDFSEPSIFERDIEHRDAGHVLSKQEALDVAIPSVLDDAIEAITCDDSDQVEIVAPHAAPPPLALSSQALSAHSHSQVHSPELSIASSPAHSPSPPLSSSGAVEAPPGSMAAQIAERLASSKAGTSGFEDATTSPNTTNSRHRRPNSDVSASSNSSMRSRSPQASLPVGVQQVLDASNNNSPPANATTTAGRSIPTSPAVAAYSKSPSLATTPRSGSVSHANLTSLISHTPSNSIKPVVALPTATALPSLPLPNPFRTHSPNTSHLPLPDGGMPMLSSVSMDGAIMTTSESATMGASLDGLADVIAASQAPSNSKNGGSLLAASPLSRMKGLGLEEELGPYSTRSPVLSNSASPKNSDSTDQNMPGSFTLGLSGTSDPSTSPQISKSSSSSSMTAKRRLSFFSYADIINQTPAEILDFDTALRQADGAVNNSTTSSMGRSLSAGPKA